MDSKFLLGIIAVTIFGSFTVSGMFVQAGLEDLERIEIVGNTVQPFPNNVPVESIASCPNTHPILIGGSYGFGNSIGNEAGSLYHIEPFFDILSNSYKVVVIRTSTDVNVEVTAKALCGKINFPMMGMIGGELLDINTVSLLVGAIGVNPVITGLVGISLAGVTGQVIWFIHKKKNQSTLQ